jgi:hypothetical protein
MFQGWRVGFQIRLAGFDSLGVCQNTASDELNSHRYIHFHSPSLRRVMRLFFYLNVVKYLLERTKREF